MKRLLFLLLIPSLSWGIAPGDIPSANDCSARLVNAAQDMAQYAQFVKAMDKNGYRLNVPLSTSTVTLPQAMQDEIVARWAALKQAAVNVYNTCP